ncbi:MAG: sulfite exporter TauE/SafE family protein [Candidatus Kapaibacteriota bacterium]|jgi:uncharacterized membrane protein YfcA
MFDIIIDFFTNDFYGYNLLQFIILFIIGLAVGFINVIAGGGSVFVLPFLIFMGLDTTTANGTNRLGIFMQTFSAVRTYKKEFIDEYSLSWKMSIITIPGAIIGTLAAVRITGEVFEFILGLVMIFVMLSMVFNLKISNVKEELMKMPFIMYPVMFLIGFYGGFIQVGIGFILMYAVNKILHKNLVKTNFHKSFIVMIYTIPSLLIFIFNGNLNLLLGLILGIGSSLGSYIAVKVSISKGEKIIKPVLLISMLLIALKLLKVY